jgi:hypothetical protein
MTREAVNDTTSSENAEQNGLYSRLPTLTRTRFTDERDG